VPSAYLGRHEHEFLFPPFLTDNPKQGSAPSAALSSAGLPKLAGVDAMLVRAVRSRQRGQLVRVIAAAAIAIAALHPQRLAGQEPATPLPATHIVKRGDTLWDIAKLYLGDAFLWPEIYRLNTDVIEDPHWIYPGEALKLPGTHAKVVAVTPPPAAEAPAPKIAAPVVTPAPTPPTPAPIVAAPRSTVRFGEYTAAPWVDQTKGPAGSGYIIQAADIPGIASVDQSRLHLYDKVMVAPPAGPASARQLYLAYRFGPLIEDLGQVIIPTGLIEVPRPAPTGEAAVGRVVAMFGPVLQGQRLIPFDTAGASPIGRPTRVENGKAGTVRWVLREPVIASLQDYVVLDITKHDGVNVGDQIELYLPRQKPVEGRDLTLPEVSIGRAQVLRVTPFGATAIITAQEQPKIEEGTAARVAAKMP
jgi:LysM repeat protein